MSMRWRLGTGLLLLILALAACSEPDDTPLVTRPKATSAPTGQQGSGSLTGGVSGTTTSEPVVQYVAIDSAAFTLNVPAASGVTAAGLAATASVTARAVLTSGATDPNGVEWQSQDPQRLTVDASGGVSVRPEAAVGVTSLTVVSRRNPALKAQVGVTITRDGILQVAELPEGEGYLRLNVTRNGSFVANQILDQTGRVRLPEGPSYEAQLQRVSSSGTSLVAEWTHLGIAANGLTIATASP